MATKMKVIGRRIGRALHSSRGKSVLLYLMFVVVAYLFWLMLSLDAEVTKDYEINVELTDCPTTVTMIDDNPRITVNVRAKGIQLLRYSWGEMPKLKIDFKTFATEDNHIVVPRAQLASLLTEYFGSGVTITLMKPDALNLVYTSRPGVPVKVRVTGNYSAAAQSVISGALLTDVDSVLVYSVDDLPASLTEILTDSITRTGLKDSLTLNVKLRPVKGLKIIPDNVNITVPVEPLIAKKQEIPIIVENTPPGMRMLTFPSKVEISYLVPMSKYKTDLPAAAIVNFADSELPSEKVPVKLGKMPDAFHNISFSPDSVEYLIER